MNTKRILLFLSIFAIIVFPGCKKDPGSICNLFEPDTSIVQVDKPNIYIYPTKTIDLNISLNFPQGGSVVESIPAYGNGWYVRVDTSGLINDFYTYLFYEARTPNFYQQKKGWIISGSTAEYFFRENMNTVGFIENEINDFIEYWIPLLDTSKEYLVYPQFINDINPLIELEFFKQPDCLLRLFYVIKINSENIVKIKKPDIPRFTRTGFTVTEWGVIIK